MKRFQIHVSKEFRAEVIVDTDSEQLARSYVLSLPDDALRWHSDLPTKIEHADTIDGNPEE